MRTNIFIDDILMKEALKLSGARTKKEAVALGLKMLVRMKKQEKIKAYKGKLAWDGDLDEMRND